jgi:putative SOS response-associated peptidase YedK
MCSRYSLTSPPEAVRSYFDTLVDHDFPARYNIAPTQPAMIIAAQPKGEREAILVRWGLIPGWVKDPKSYTTMINARSETAAEKPSFRGALRHRRCLVPTDGFYEWSGPTKSRQPHLISRARPDGNTTVFAMAGIYEHWVGADGSEIDTMAILTVAANATVGTIHDRMPVILDPADFDRWLDCRAGTAINVSDLMRPAPDDFLMLRPISPRLNSARADGPDLHEPYHPLPGSTDMTLF